MNNAVCCYDFTYHDIDKTAKDIILLLNLHCKKWCFQKEKGEETGKEHWQGRFSLKIKKRRNNIPMNLGHYSPTSTVNKDNDFYVCKEETRIEGPYKDDDEVIYIPRQIREIDTLYPWQESIINKMNVWDTRTINQVYDPTGNIGKTTLIGYCRAYKLATKIPMCNDFNKVMEMVMCMPTAKNYIFDFPKCLSKENLRGLYAAIEEIKNGYAYDTRYSFKDKFFDSPNIWIFSNEPPNYDYLSSDRWKLWMVKNNELILM
uniref:hypothetical protein n=1 Tax=Polynucleobacter sp. TaxID=2029855 RepID=UPI004047DAAD